MRPALKLALQGVAVAVLLVVHVDRADGQSSTARVVSAANAFIAALDPAQRTRLLFAFDDAQQRARWSNLPTRSVPRAGIKFGEMTEPQRTAAHALLRAAFSKRGYEKAMQVVEADEYLNKNQPNNPGFGTNEFYFSILGTPSDRAPWMLQFGGHHLALNVSIDGAKGVLTPSLVGAQPGLYTIEGRTIRPMGQESDKAMAFLNTLDESQRGQAVLSFRVADMVLGPGQDGKTIQPEGLKGSALNAQQRTMLLDLMSEWSGIVHESAAEARMAELRADIDNTWFAWSGPTSIEAGQNITAYYRIQGPRVVIEYAPQQTARSAGNHIHSMYRDPTNDYGRKPK